MFNPAVNKTYFFDATQQRNQLEAIDFCRRINATLAKVESLNESNWIFDHIGPRGFFLPLQIIHGVLPTTWLDGSAMLWTNWDPDFACNHACCLVQAGVGRTWTAAHCFQDSYTLCESHGYIDPFAIPLPPPARGREFVNPATGKSYITHPLPRTLWEAQHYCDYFNMSLAKITSPAEAAWLFDTFHVDFILLPIDHHEFIDEIHHWEDGFPILWTDWVHGARCLYDCCNVQVRASDRKWYFDHCGDRTRTICESPHSPFVPPTDPPALSVTTAAPHVIDKRSYSQTYTYFNPSANKTYVYDNLNKRNQSAAVKFCDNFAAKMVQVQSPQESNWISHNLWPHWYILGAQQVTRGQIATHWLDGTVITWSHWEHRQCEDPCCVLQVRPEDQKWGYFPCEDKEFTICEKEGDATDEIERETTPPPGTEFINEQDNKVYIHDSTERTATEAEQYCNHFDATVVKPQSFHETMWLLRNVRPSWFTLSISRLGRHQTPLQWSDGAVIEWSFMSNEVCNYDCCNVQVQPNNGLWRMFHCSDRVETVCELPIIPTDHASEEPSEEPSGAPSEVPTRPPPLDVPTTTERDREWVTVGTARPPIRPLKQVSSRMETKPDQDTNATLVEKVAQLEKQLQAVTRELQECKNDVASIR